MRTWQLEKEFQDRGATWKSNCEEKNWEKLSKEEIISQIKMHVAAFFYLLIKSVFNFRQAQWSYAELEVCCVYKKKPKKQPLF